jgi:hypothetical protein
MILERREYAEAKVMADLSWGHDFDYSLGQIAKVRLEHTHYLGLRFRRFLELEFGTNSYFQNGKLIARREVQDGETQKADTIFVRREAVFNFVHGTKQVLLWCVCSQRYSERLLQEFGLGEKYEPIRMGHYCYDFRRIDLDKRRQRERPRMATMTETFGKSIVKL